MMETDGYTSVMAFADEESLSCQFTDTWQPSSLACWNRCPSADFAVPGYSGSSTISLPRMQWWPYHRMVFFRLFFTINVVLTKVAPGQPAPVSHCDSILPTPKLFCGHCLHLCLCTFTFFLQHSLDVCIGIFHNCVNVLR